MELTASTIQARLESWAAFFEEETGVELDATELDALDADDTDWGFDALVLAARNTGVPALVRRACAVP